VIHNALSIITELLNEHIRNELHMQEDMVVMNSLIDIKGDINVQVENKVCVFLQNIEEERMAKNGGFQTNPGATQPMRFNLYVVVAAHFPDPNYREALRFISHVIEFFQGKPVFDRSNSPTLSQNIERLSFEFVNQDFMGLNNLWSSIGAKYIPSVVLKVRMLTFNQSVISGDVPDIVRLKPKNKVLQDVIKGAAVVGAAALLGKKPREGTMEPGTEEG
jgi:hypothetical protein